MNFFSFFGTSKFKTNYYRRVFAYPIDFNSVSIRYWNPYHVTCKHKFEPNHKTDHNRDNSDFNNVVDDSIICVENRVYRLVELGIVFEEKQNRLSSWNTKTLFNFFLFKSWQALTFYNNFWTFLRFDLRTNLILKLQTPKMTKSIWPYWVSDWNHFPNVIPISKIIVIIILLKMLRFLLRSMISVYIFF